MTETEMKQRTKQFALRVMRMVDSLPNGRSADVLGRQLLRSGTSVGANYRSACRARSRADLYSKLGVVEEEADESAYWMELLIEGGLMSEAKLGLLMREADELVSIVVASRLTIRRGMERSGRANQKSKIKNQKSSDAI